jgi:aspartate/methionine/tyrosine aminotransferase
MNKMNEELVRSESRPLDLTFFLSLSTHTFILKKQGHGFHSVIQILKNDLGNDVHFVWAVSKDFGASGLRVGIVYSQSEVFLRGLATSNIFSCVSQPIQYLVSELWTDDQFLDEFLDESRHRLLISYSICISKLQEMVVPYVPATSGMFVYIDLSALLPNKTFAAEQQLTDLMYEHARIVLTPGESQRDPRPGMFRICYAWVVPAVLEIAMERLSRLVAKIRKLDWSDLNERSLQGIL